jgi:hypothetical protein
VKESIRQDLNKQDLISQDLISQDLDHALSRRQLISGLAGLGTSTFAAKVFAQSSPAQSAMAPVMRPALGETLVYDDFNAGGWPSPRWLKF